MQCFSRLVLISVAGLTMLSACHSDSTTDTTDTQMARATPEQRVTVSDQTTIQSLAEDIRTAPDAIAEANALKRFRQYASDHGYTYRVQSFRPGTRLQITDAPARGYPVITEVNVYHADERVSTFTFTPRDNHNIYLITKSPT
jgi:hypothetical protein